MKKMLNGKHPTMSYYYPNSIHLILISKGMNCIYRFRLYCVKHFKTGFPLKSIPSNSFVIAVFFLPDPYSFLTATNEDRRFSIQSK